MIPTHVSAWAVASGYLGLVSFIFFCIPGPFAIATGVLGLRQIGRQPELNGKVRAMTGIVLGTMATMVLGGVVVVFAVANSWQGLAAGALVTLVLVALILIFALRQ